MQNLFEIQSLEFADTLTPETEVRIAELRAHIPPAILTHYDRLGDRGKKGVALVNHRTCSACHMSVPLGVVLELSHGNEVRACGTCGRYLYLQDVAMEEYALPAKKHGLNHSKQLAAAR